MFSNGRHTRLSITEGPVPDQANLDAVDVSLLPAEDTETNKTQRLKYSERGVLAMRTQRSLSEDVGSIPGLAQWV